MCRVFAGAGEVRRLKIVRAFPETLGEVSGSGAGGGATRGVPCLCALSPLCLALPALPALGARA